MEIMLMLEHCAHCKEHNESEALIDSSDDGFPDLKVSSPGSSSIEKVSIFSTASSTVIKASFARAKFVGEIGVTLKNGGLLGPRVFKAGQKWHNKKMLVGTASTC